MEIGLSPEAVQRALGMQSGHISLDAPVPDTEDTSMLELIPDREGEEPDERTQREALRDVLEASLTHLPDREARRRRIIETVHPALTALGEDLLERLNPGATKQLHLCLPRIADVQRLVEVLHSR